MQGESVRKQGADPARDLPTGPAAIWAPWRLPYLEQAGESEKSSGPPTASSGSFILDAWNTPARDRDNLVIVRSAHGLIMLNRYPYASGHLLVALGEPRPTLTDYSPQQRAQLWMLVDQAAEILERTLQPQGMNIGINQGRAAGAGVPQHLHAHLVPRWSGDVNFITAVGSIRVIPASLDAMWERFHRTINRSSAAGHA